MMFEKTHMDYLQDVANEDVRHLEMKERTYGGSWKKRGGVGAFMMLARKWDRIENMVSEVMNSVRQYDVFDHISRNPTGDDGTMIAEIRDLRRYLMLVEAEMIAKKVVDAPDHLTKEQRKMVDTYTPSPPTFTGQEQPFGFQLENEIDTTQLEDKPFVSSYGDNLTTFEFNSIKDTTIVGGSMAGYKVASIYYVTTNNRYRIDKQYKEEYGQT